MAVVKGAVRRTQLISTYGVGAVLPLGDEAFMVTGLDRWGDPEIDLHEPRLERELRVRGFVSPPAGNERRGDVPVVRFPWWHSCPRCRRLAPHGDFTFRERNQCPDCDIELVPSRFVVACPKGHIDDFPYLRWVHRGRPDTARTHELLLEAGGVTASLASIRLSCSCGARRTMDQAFNRWELREVTRCTGRRPWLGGDPETCEEVPRTLQRGASNVWFPNTRSAVSIPPWSEGVFQALNKHWAFIRGITDDAMLAGIFRDNRVDRRSGYSIEQLVSAVHERRRSESDAAPSSDATLRREEFQALQRGKAERSRDQQFAAHEVTVPTELNPWLGRVTIATRLREVRALQSFSRVLPNTAEPASLAVEEVDWLPAIEVKGEGVFLELSIEELERWEASDAVQARVGPLRQGDVDRHERWGVAPSREITPRLVLVHTLAHALIDEVALSSGYPSASLRERLYVGNDMAALLIYTATSDAAGSLGGVAAQGEPDVLGPMFLEAVRRQSWCSSDPVCIETEVTGVDSLNRAACHSCLLLPETSCEEMNVFLDRALLVGTPDQPELGFFSELVR